MADSGSVRLCLHVSVQVRDIKEELGGLGGQMEEMRAVCRQLQSELKKFPDCSEASFEAEADTLMDSWLDVRNVQTQQNQIRNTF